ncbi:Hsp20/alpha crystallin family, partial [Aspergillus sclerotialis]
MANLYELNQPPHHPFWDFLANLENNPFNFGPRTMNPPPYHDTTADHQQQGGESSRSAGADTTSYPEPQPPTGPGEQSQDRSGHDWRRGHGWGGCGFHPYGMGFGGFPFTTPGHGYGYRYTPWGGFGSFGGPRGPPHRWGRGHHRGGGCHGSRRGHGHGHGSESQEPGASQIPTFLQNLATNLGATLEQLFPNQPHSQAQGQVDFTPPIDIISTSSHYIIHVSLPGAKKEDLSVEYDVEESVLRVAGVVYRPDLDEEMHRGLVVAERGREIGVFEREVRLGTREVPATVLVDGIEGRLVDGVLR